VELPARADVVVVGGGVVGTATLYYLTQLGATDVVLLERDTLAAGSTGHCAGGVRTLFSDELNVRICAESIRRLERFADELGDELDLRFEEHDGIVKAARLSEGGLAVELFHILTYT
jgi:sarcosine oxidase subunit beta